MTEPTHPGDLRTKLRPNRRRFRFARTATTTASVVAIPAGLVAVMDFVSRAPGWPTLRAAAPYLSIFAVAVLMFVGVRWYADRRIDGLRSEIAKAQADAALALEALRNPVAFRTLLRMSELPSGLIVDVEKDLGNRDAYRLALRLGIVEPREITDGHVYWLWRYGGEKPNREGGAPLDPGWLSIG